MPLTDAQRQLLKDTKGWLENARLGCQKFEYRPESGAKEMFDLGVEIMEIGREVAASSLYTEGSVYITAPAPEHARAVGGRGLTRLADKCMTVGRR